MVKRQTLILVVIGVILFIAGSAIAYATMLLNGVGNPVFSADAVGFTTVTEPQTGIYCVPIPDGATGIQPIISDAGGDNDAVFSFASPEVCPGDYEIAQESGTAIGQLSFLPSRPQYCRDNGAVLENVSVAK